MLSADSIDAIRQRLIPFHPEKIILFGSQARGTADSHSDVDLLVVSWFVGKRRLQMLAMDRALKGLDFARDIVLLTPEEYETNRHIPGTVARPASIEGKLLYERT